MFIPSYRSRRGSGEGRLISDDLHEHSLAPISIELPLKYLLPRSKVEFAIRHGYDNLPAHNLVFEMPICVVLSRSVIMVLDVGACGALFQPDIVIAITLGAKRTDKSGPESLSTLNH
jgi:hypothetical protein